MLSLFVLAALLQPLLALVGEGGLAAAAFPLWTQNAQGQFIILDTDTGKYRLAPHQLPASVPVPYSFTYDPQRDRIWFLTTDYSNPPMLGWFDPHRGDYGFVTQYSNSPWPYSLTYRRRDGLLYALEVVPSTQGYAPTEMYADSIDQANGTKTRVAQIAPMSVE
jgi:hypothetical protein